MTGTPNTAMSVTGSTADLIREGREKLRGVTEGEWAAESRYAVFGYVTDVRSTATETVAGHDCVTMVSHGLAESDAEFIVWARNNLPAVLDALDEAQAASGAQAMVIDAVQDVIGYGGHDPECDPIDFMAVSAHDIARALKGRA